MSSSCSKTLTNTPTIKAAVITPNNETSALIMDPPVVGFITALGIDLFIALAHYFFPRS